MSRLFTATVGRTAAGSIRIQVRHFGVAVSYRKVNAAIYELAAALEAVAELHGASWVVSPEAFNSRVDVELSTQDNEQAALRRVNEVLGKMGTDWVARLHPAGTVFCAQDGWYRVDADGDVGPYDSEADAKRGAVR